LSLFIRLCEICFQTKEIAWKNTSHSLCFSLLYVFTELKNSLQLSLLSYFSVKCKIIEEWRPKWITNILSNCYFNNITFIWKHERNRSSLQYIKSRIYSHVPQFVIDLYFKRFISYFYSIKTSNNAIDIFSCISIR
jgi:hypothetical protein